jgi:hypothetical protein
LLPPVQEFGSTATPKMTVDILRSYCAAVTLPLHQVAASRRHTNPV